MKRTPIRRRPRQEDPALFDLITATGEKYLWPYRWQSEADWQDLVIKWAVDADHETQWWHAVQTKYSNKGWFDLAIFQPTRKVGLLIELKARDRQGEAKTPSKAQWKFITAAAACGYDVRSWLWPDDAREAFEVLTGRPFAEAGI